VLLCSCAARPRSLLSATFAESQRMHTVRLPRQDSSMAPAPPCALLRTVTLHHPRNQFGSDWTSCTPISGLPVLPATPVLYTFSAYANLYLACPASCLAHNGCRATELLNDWSTTPMLAPAPAKATVAQSAPNNVAGCRARALRSHGML